jgi:glycosyltransferase 2 family protein
MLAQLQRKLVIAAALGLVVVLVIGVISDLHDLGESFSSFSWKSLPLILGFTLINYVLRWLKWHYYLHTLNVQRDVSWHRSMLLFTAGMVMAVTPGKVGEVLKSYLLRRINGTPIGASAPIVLAERVTDGLAMLLLMAAGLTLYKPAQPVFIALLTACIAGIVMLQFRPLCKRGIALTARLPLGARLAPRLDKVYESTQRLLGLRILCLSTLISIVSWFFECLAFYYILRGLGEPASWLLLLQATFIFAASTLFGLISFLPGGLGVSEASSAGLLVALIPMPLGPSTVATIIIRFCTLWFGVSLGALALSIFRWRYGAEPVIAESVDAARTVSSV